MGKRVAAMIFLGDYYGEIGYTKVRFAYNNVKELSAKLESWGWEVSAPAADGIATREHCMHYLQECIDKLEKDDWLLFYYVGHADRYTITGDDAPVYLVTSLQNTGAVTGDPAAYFSDRDYAGLVDTFREKAPGGHLITILDCCYAFGMINNYVNAQDFHTVFAASNGNRTSIYTDNSFFFKSLKKSWNLASFSTIKRSIESSMRNDYPGYAYVNFCNIQLAKNFSDQTFKKPTT